MSSRPRTIHSSIPLAPPAIPATKQWDASPSAVLADADGVARHEGATTIGIKHLLVALTSLREGADQTAILARLGLNSIRPRPYPAWLGAGLEYLQHAQERHADRLPLDPDLPPILRQKILGRKGRGASLQKWVSDLQFLGDPLVAQVFMDPHASLSGPLARLDFAGRVAADVQRDLLQGVLGQPEACQALGNLAFRIAMGSTGNGPRGIAMFLGPPGVGKTLSGRLFSESLARHGVLSPEKSRPLVVDLTQYSQPNQAAQLFGQGTTTGFVARHVASFPESVLIFDEIEKAHPLVLESFLSVLSDGTQCLEQGKAIDYRSCIFIFTSNLGSEAWDHPDLQAADAFSVDPIDLLGIAGEKNRDSDGWNLPPTISRAFLSRLSSGAIVLFAQPKGQHFLALMQSRLSQPSKRHPEETHP